MLSVLWPVSFMATDRDTLARSEPALTFGPGGGPGRSGAPHACDVFREEVVNEGLVAQASPFGLTPDRVEHLGVDPDRDQSPGRGPEGRPPDSSHRPDLGGRSLRDVGEVNPAPPPHRRPALCGSLGAR